MLFNLIIYGIFDGVCEVDYNADLKIDIESFELPSVSGFEFQLPPSTVPIIWSANNKQYEISTQLILRSTTIITLVDATGVSLNDVFWIGTEQIQVTSISGNDIGITRGLGGTHINRHFVDIENSILLYMNTFPTSFIGLKVALKNIKTGLFYSVGIIESEPKYSNGLLNFSCSDIIESLDIDLPKLYNDERFYQTVGYFNLLQDTIRDFETNSGGVQFLYLLGSIPDFFDYFNIYGLGLSSDIIKTGAVVQTDKIKTYKDVIIALLKATKSVIFFDRNIREYQSIQIAPTLSFETPPTIKMLDYLKTDGNYSVSKAENIKTVVFSYSKNGNENKITANLTNMAFGKKIDVDLTGFTNIDTKGIYSAILRYLYDTSLYYSIVEIDSTKMIVNNLQVGKIYQFTDVLNYSFQDISNKCMYLGNENDTLFFGIIRDFSKTLIAPAIPVHRTAAKELTFGFPDIDFNVSDFLNTTSITLEFARFQNRGYEIYYFTGDNQKVQLFNRSTGVLLSAEEIDFINGNVITLINDVAAGDYWLTYDVYANASSEQKKFFYFGVDRY